MALPTTGEIKMSQINTELGRASNATIALDSAERNGYAPINQCSPSRPSGANPASMSEWRGYNHSASCSGLPTIYIYLQNQNNQNTNFLGTARVSCGGALIDPSINPGDIYVIFDYSSNMGSSRAQLIIPQGQNTGTYVIPAGTLVGSWSIEYVYILGGNANLINCLPSTPP